MTDKLDVIFRANKSGEHKGEITAVFPTEPADVSGNDMVCYAHIGQHGNCSMEWYRTTRPADPAEYAELLFELTGIYAETTLYVRKRVPAGAAAIRQEKVAQAAPVSELRYVGSDWILSQSDCVPGLLAALLDCGAPGDASAAVQYVRQQFDVHGDINDCRAYLEGYGAWKDHELADHDENLNRLVWLTGCALAETDSEGNPEEAYFCAY